MTQPHPASHRQVRSDNLALVPCNLLPFRAAWQKAANALPDGAVLIVLPRNNFRQKRALLAVAKTLGEEGHQVSVRPADAFEEVQPVMIGNTGSEGSIHSKGASLLMIEVGPFA